MKILHIITRLIQGGAQHDTIMKCAALVKAGHEVWLAHGPIYGPEGSLRDEALASGATLVQIDPMRRAILPVHDVATGLALRKLIRRVRPDIVHTHSSKAGIVGRAAAWHCRVGAVVHTIHGLPFHERQNRLVHRMYVGAERWAAKRCHRMIGITQAMCDAFAQHGIGRPEQFEVVPDGVDISRFTPSPDARGRIRSEFGIPIDAPLIGLVARLDPLKGHDDLIVCLHRLRQTHDDVRVIFVGDGWDRRRLDQNVRREGQHDRVIFTGLLSQDRVGDMMNALDVMALPSYQEGQGLVLVEALLCGCPIVAYDVGGIGEACIDGKTGRLVPMGDRDALLDALRWMLDHPDERGQLARHGSEYVRERFDQSILVKKLHRVYEGVLRRDNASQDTATRQ